jgi:hypothetical protein
LCEGSCRCGEVLKSRYFTLHSGPCPKELTQRVPVFGAPETFGAPFVQNDTAVFWDGGLWVVINPMRTLDETDKGLADGKAFFAAQGEANMKHAGELAAACIESVQTNVFVVNAKESYADAGWAKAAPEIYGQP